MGKRSVYHVSKGLQMDTTSRIFLLKEMPNSKNSLTQLWKAASPKPAGSGTQRSCAKAACCRPASLRETPVSLLKAFN